MISPIGTCAAHADASGMGMRPRWPPSTRPCAPSLCAWRPTRPSLPNACGKNLFRATDDQASDIRAPGVVAVDGERDYRR